MKLREGVKFQNGADFNADDVVFTFSPERLIGKDSPLPQGRAYFGVLDHVEKVGDHTVRFVTKAPDPLLEQRLASWASWIVDKDDWLEKAEGKGFAQFPVGTGPYMLEDYRPDQHVKLKAFDDYWGDKPSAATVTFKKVQEPAGRIAGLVSGEFDMITNVAPDQIAQIDSYDDIETRSVVLANSHVLVYNTDNEVLKDKRVRQAMNLAIDRKLLVEALWGGKAVVPNGHQYPEYGDMYQADRPGFEYNPEKAKKLLQEAGYEGETIVYSTEPNYYLNALPAAQAILEMWKAVGINAEAQRRRGRRHDPERPADGAQLVELHPLPRSGRRPVEHLGPVWLGPEDLGELVSEGIQQRWPRGSRPLSTMTNATSSPSS
ncbi:ABC transporter substrate-binding protein [Jiella pelagia]|uniref:ABC transporter substrate-binding protein n=1 Tax=Jiella pelagia TaxID=2986949 RepID=A0ABY7BVR0_9HYPH|nr:ABC transporter substrate-binding protein [Jiella pelagia]WAP67743.1 ABC transporter substrate-binding protein [Jiella pelagia]